MCGIFAYIRLWSIDERNKRLFSFVFMHGQNRGPEFSCFNKYNNYILGFHRLAINGYNDVNSNQPLNNENLSLICNGKYIIIKNCIKNVKY